MALLKLRDYQQEALKAVHNSFEQGISNQLIVLPTGSGKTIIMAAIERYYGKRVLVLAHREELIKQAFNKFKLYSPDADIGICKAKKNELDHRIVVGSVQSCWQPKRLEQLKKENFAILMIDEAHHTESKSYQKIIKGLGFNDSSKLLIGVTATPQRADKKQLGNTFEKIVYSKSIGSLIKAGYLPPVIGRRILTDCSLKGVKSKYGDFITKQLSHAVNTAERNKFVVAKYKEHASGRKGVAFCVGVKHAKDLAATFNEQGIKAQPVWGLMPKEQREQVLDDLHTGAIDIVTSCELLTEGFDEETISTIIMARPTKSKSLYIQMVGRGLRKHPTKKNCLVLDFTDTGNNLKNVITLKKAIPEAQLIEEPKEKAAPEKTPRNFNQIARKDIDREFDIVGSFNYLWVDNGSQEWSLMDDNGNEIVAYHVGKGFIADLFYKNGATQPLVTRPLPLDYCLGRCEDYARQHLSIKFADANASWMYTDQPPTPGQLNLLQGKNLPFNVETKADAAVAIRTMIAQDKKKKRLQRETMPWENLNTSLKIRSINSERG